MHNVKNTECQNQAIFFGDGPLSIVSGAGTGKTYVLIQRIVHLIHDRKIDPSKILVITFTEKSNHEIQKRLEEKLSISDNNCMVYTFNAFGNKILQEQTFALNLSPQLKTLTQAEATVFFNEHLSELLQDSHLSHYQFFEKSDPKYATEGILKIFQKIKNENISIHTWAEKTHEFLNDPNNEPVIGDKNLELIHIFKTLEKIKKKSGVIDFGDQLYIIMQYYKKDPSFMAEYQNNIQYILVDEFQDTNLIQFEFLKILTKKHKNITIVGDSNQSIYNFRGSKDETMDKFEKEFESNQIVLKENHRSSYAILTIANTLIKHNLNNRDLNLVTSDSNPQKNNQIPVHYQEYNRNIQENNFIVEKIKTIKQEDATATIAILLRTNAQVKRFEKSLHDCNISAVSSVSFKLYELPIINTLLALCDVIVDPSDSYSLFYLASGYFYQIDAKSMYYFTSKMRQSNYEPLVKTFEKSLTEEIKNTHHESGIPEQTKQKIKMFLDDISYYQKKSIKITVGQLIYEFLEKKNYIQELISKDDWQNTEYLNLFFEQIQIFQNVSKYKNVMEFIEYIKKIRESNDVFNAQQDIDSTENYSVQVLTVHAAKGLEFSTVFLPNMIKSHFPMSSKKNEVDLILNPIFNFESINLIEEERRLCYVAITRAKKELYISWAKNHQDRQRPVQPSQFIEEMNLAFQKEETSKEKNFKDSCIQSFQPSPQFIQELQLEKKLFSASAINAYTSCPLQYKYKYILKIPVPMHHTAAFGVSIHRVIEDILRYKQSGEINNINEKHLQKWFYTHWICEGFLSKEHEQHRFNMGLEALKIFLKQEKEREAIPSLIEESFKFKIDSFTIIGKFDRVDTGKTLSVIDYKTKNIKTQKDATKEVSSNLQIFLYGLALKEKFGSYPDSLTLHFVISQLEGVYICKDEKIFERKKLKILNTINQIISKKFNPKTGFHCKWCAYSKYCPAFERQVIDEENKQTITTS